MAKPQKETVMKKQWAQHIGDDQLVYGMPKHMVGVSGGNTQKNRPVPGDPPYRQPSESNGKTTYRTVQPKAKACDKCQAMAGKKFMEKPEPPHPNCKCDIRQHEHIPQKRYLSEFIEGYEGNAVQQFFGLGLVKVRIKHITGALASGVEVYSNLDGIRSSHTLTKDVSFTFSTLTDTPVLWSIQIVQKGADNTVVQYWIEYEE